MSANRFPDVCRWCDREVAAGEGRLIQVADARQCNVPAHWRRGQCWHAVHINAPACRQVVRDEASEKRVAELVLLFAAAS